MRGFKTGKKRLIPLILCSVLVLQQTCINTSFASVITNGSGGVIEPNSTGRYEIRPELFNDKVGFREFKDLNCPQAML